jgi:Uma2 family endonuclease
VKETDMTTATMPPPLKPAEMSGDEFLRLHGDDRGVELVRGMIRRKAMPGARHGQICFRFGAKLGQFLDTNDCGHVFSHDTFVRTDVTPDSYRGPDFQFFRYETLPKGIAPNGIPGIPPDLVVEVRSPSDTWRSMTAKAVEYLNADIKVVILIDPFDPSATVFRSDARPESVKANGTLAVPDLLPGFSLPLAKLFE